MATKFEIGVVKSFIRATIQAPIDSRIVEGVIASNAAQVEKCEVKANYNRLWTAVTVEIDNGDGKGEARLAEFADWLTKQVDAILVLKGRLRILRSLEEVRDGNA